MRLKRAFVSASFLSLACSAGNGVVDAGDDFVPLSNDANDDFSEDISFVSDTAVVDGNPCTYDDADPVGLCVQKQALANTHKYGFKGTVGVAPSWQYTTGAVDKTEAGQVAYTLADTAAYASAITTYRRSALVYGNLAIDAELQSDLGAIALQFETSFTVPPTEYDGELYYHLRQFAQGLRAIGRPQDGDKIDALANAYGLALYTNHFFALSGSGGPGLDGGRDATVPDSGHLDATVQDGASPEAGPADAAMDGARDAATVHDAGAHDAGGVPDAASHDAGSAEGGTPADGIFGNGIATGQFAYEPADVASAAYAMLDMATQSVNAGNPQIPAWLAAARSALNHIESRARETTTGMYYTSLVAGLTAEGGAHDALAQGSSALPADALMADTQATIVLYMIRAQYLVTSTTKPIVPESGVGDGPIVDSGVTGPLVSMLDFPFEGRADQAIASMNGTHPLWDGPQKFLPHDGGNVDASLAKLQAGHGYMDGYVPSTATFITTKSTRPNAFMAGAIHRAVLTNLNPYGWQFVPLVGLLENQLSFSVPLHSNLITVVNAQQAFFLSASQGFSLLDAGPAPHSYWSSAVSSAVEGMNELGFDVLDTTGQ